MAEDFALVYSVVYVVAAEAAASEADAPSVVEWSRASWVRAAALSSR